MKGQPFKKHTKETVISNQIVNFNFQNSHCIRTVIDQTGEYWFVASDVCKGLEIADAAKAVRAINKQLNDANLKGTISNRTLIETAGGLQEMVCVSEAGLNLLIMQSRKKEAIPFKWWIASEVLPSIRKTGSYTLTLTDEQQHALATAVANHCKEWGVLKQNTPTKSGNQEMVYINEPNLYRVIFRSNKKILTININYDIISLWSLENSQQAIPTVVLMWIFCACLSTNYAQKALSDHLMSGGRRLYNTCKGKTVRCLVAVSSLLTPYRRCIETSPIVIYSQQGDLR